MVLIQYKAKNKKYIKGLKNSFFSGFMMKMEKFQSKMQSLLKRISLLINLNSLCDELTYICKFNVWNKRQQKTFALFKGEYFNTYFN